MGYDTSHHPVDVALITERLVPYILGEAEIDDLVEAVVRITKVRFRANAWGLGASRHLREAERAFDSDLYIWGRPFFVTLDGTNDIAEAIDRYLDADLDDVDFIAAEMLDHLDSSLVGVVQPSDDGQLPEDDDAIAAGALRNLKLLRAAVQNLDTGTPVELGGGETADPRELLRRETIWVLLNFAAELRPGWMDRGTIWPSGWSAEADVDLGPVFESPTPLLGRLQELDIDFFAPTGIVENYMVGAMVEADQMSSFIAALCENEPTLVGAFGEPTEFAEMSFRKLLEAASDAHHRGLAFCEATEIYSGFSGILN